MNTPDLKQAIRIRCYGPWLKRKMIWYTFNYIMRLIEGHLYLCSSGVSQNKQQTIQLIHNIRCKERFSFIPLIQSIEMGMTVLFKWNNNQMIHNGSQIILY
jgi:hypothetical protein